MALKFTRIFTKKLFPAYFVLVAGFLITVMTTIYVWYNAEEKDSIRFNTFIRYIEDEMSSALNSNINVLRAASGLFIVKQDATYNDFRAFARGMEIRNNFPGIEGLGYARRVQQEELDLFLSEMHTMVGESFRVHPESSASEYFPVTYLQPLELNGFRDFGYDLSSEPLLMKAMQRAADLGVPFATDKITLVDGVEGFVIYSPIYRNDVMPTTIEERQTQLAGFVYSPLHMQNFMRKILDPVENNEFQIKIYDGKVISSENLVFTNESKETDDTLMGVLVEMARKNLGSRALTVIVPVEGHFWTVELTTTPSFFGGSDRRFIPLIVLLGFLMSLLTFINMRNQIMSREVSEQRTSEIRNSRDALIKSESLKDSILNSMNSMVAVLDENGEIIRVNRTWKRFFGTSFLKGNYISEANKFMNISEDEVSRKQYESIVEGIRSILNNDNSEFTIEYTLEKEGKNYWFLMYASRLAFPNHGVVMSSANITELKKLEKQKEEFIGIASHELKTPVTSVKAYAQILHKRFSDRGDEISAGLLDKMNLQIDRLTKLIRELLDTTRMEGGTLSFNMEKISIDALVAEVVEEMQRISSTHKIRIVGESGTSVYADKDRTSQVLVNLISNAVKYSPDSTEVTVEVVRKEKMVKVAIKDLGIGIPIDDQLKIFDRFYRVGGISGSTFGGLGLGLFISKEIIERQGGHIWVDSEEGKGSVFSFTLPGVE